VEGVVRIGSPDAIWLLDIGGVGVGGGVIHIPYDIRADMLRVCSGGVEVVDEHSGNPLDRGNEHSMVVDAPENC